jgi:predicted  nucleic acid-binding Zn-ribbon protein
MEPRRDPFRIDLRSAKLCMELDCSTIFDAGMYQHCPTCGSAEYYPLESWLNRDRARPAPAGRAPRSAEAAAAFVSASRARWLERLRGARVESEAGPAAAPVRLQTRVPRRRVG